MGETMMKRTLLLFLLVAPSAAQIVANLHPALCFVCGEGKVVTNREAVVQFTSTSGSSGAATTTTSSCGDLADLGQTGQIDSAQCDLLPDLIHDDCGCVGIPTPGTFPQCHVCGSPEVRITNATRTISFPGHPPYSCAQIDLAGLNGQLEPAGCGALPGILWEGCGCRQSSENVALASAGTYPTCEVCGVGRSISLTSDDAVVFLHETSLTCPELRDAGLMGNIAPAYCAGLPQVISTPCGCSNTVQDSGGGAAIPVSPTPSPSECSVCGEGHVVTEPDREVQLESSSGGTMTTVTTTCGRISNLVSTGDLQCSALPDTLFLHCGCAPQCAVCGSDGHVVTNLDGQVQFATSAGGVETTITATCRKLDEMGKTGQIAPAQCNALPGIVQDRCGCAAPTTCGVCSEGKVVTNPDAEVQIESSSGGAVTTITTTCHGLANLISSGEVNQTQCAALPGTVQDDCGCAPGMMCDVCGEGNVVTNQDTEVQIESSLGGMWSTITTTCRNLAEMGTAGQINQTQCDALPGIIQQDCGCTPVCDVCGEGKVITGDPETQVQIESSSGGSWATVTSTCGNLVELGQSGQIDPAQCQLLPSIINEKCGCALKNAAAPSFAPSLRPQPAPYSFTTPSRPPSYPTKVPSKPINTEAPFIQSPPPSNAETTTTTAELEDGGGGIKYGRLIVGLVSSAFTALVIIVVTMVETGRGREKSTTNTTAVTASPEQQEQLIADVTEDTEAAKPNGELT